MSPNATEIKILIDQIEEAAFEAGRIDQDNDPKCDLIYNRQRELRLTLFRLLSITSD